MSPTAATILAAWLNEETHHFGPDDTNYVAPRDANRFHSPQGTLDSEWDGSINPNDIELQKMVSANMHSTIDNGLYRGLAVIVKRSTNKHLIQREVEFLRKASMGEFVVSFCGWFEEVDTGIHGLVIQKCAMNLRTWSTKADPSADLEEKKLQIAEGIAKGLAYINSLDIIHNDIKPTNVLVDKFNKPFISDFGVATKRWEPLVGYTKQYFDKESLELIPDEKSDAWLLGATLWEFWSQEPFNVDEEVHLNDIHNHTIRDILKKLLRPRERRASAKQILVLFDSTTDLVHGAGAISLQQPDSNGHPLGSA
ncbi:hypothetical protein HDU96_009213 [Phlyctochytrium bullatum]|nr:hypothetical protein HDU96_009213 [Phlyctochytrium bullatum]